MALTTTQLQVIKALVTGSTIKAAADAAGIHRSTVHEWTRVHAEFRAALDASRDNFAQAVEDDLRSLAAASTALLRKLIEDEAAPAPLRLRAALAVVKSVAASRTSERERTFDDLVDAATYAADSRQALNQAIAETPAPETTDTHVPGPGPTSNGFDGETVPALLIACWRNRSSRFPMSICAVSLTGETVGSMTSPARRFA